MAFVNRPTTDSQRRDLLVERGVYEGTLAKTEKFLRAVGVPSK